MIFLTCFILCFLFSAFFSAAEMAFVSSDRLKMRKLADAGDPAARIIVPFYKKTAYFLASILIGNNVVNIAATALLTWFLSERFYIRSETLITFIMAPLLLIAGEMLPKDYGRHYPQVFLTRSAQMLKVVFTALHPFTQFTMKIVDVFLSPLEGANRRNIFVTQKEFRSLIEEGARTGVLSHPEKKIIDTILDFERVKVHSVMTPLERAPKIEIHAAVSDAKALARRTGARMFLVYEEIPEIVVGMVYVFDLLFEEDEGLGLKHFLRSPVFISQNASNEKAFFALQRRHQSYAVIVDDEQDVVGVVSIERLLAF